LAAVLISKGHSVKILDYSTTETIRKVYSSDIRKILYSLSGSIFGTTSLESKTIEQLKEIETELQTREEDYIAKISANLITMIEKEDIHWIGFKLWMGGIKQSATIANNIKSKFPNIKVFGGGPNVDLFESTIIKEFPVFDAIVFAEGELALPLLSDWAENNKYKSLHDIPSIIFKEGDKYYSNNVMRIEDLNVLPYPTYNSDIYLNIANNQKMRIFCFDESRGCPMGCAFCPDRHKYQRKRFEKTGKRCVEELKYLQEKYGVSYFRYSGSNTSIKLLNDIADNILSSNLKIRYSIFSSASNMKEEIIAKLAKSGLFGIFIGLESANQKQLKEGLGKPIKLSHMEKTISACKAHNIFISMSVIYPAPFSNEEIFQQNVDFIINNLKDYDKCSVPIFPAGLYPNSGWFDENEQFGFEIIKPTKEDYVREALTYNYQLILPRQLWKSLSYKLNGISFSKLLQECHRLALAISKHNILPYFPEANLMMANLLDYNDYRKFAKESNLLFFAGDADKLMDWNIKFNNKQSKLL